MSPYEEAESTISDVEATFIQLRGHLIDAKQQDIVRGLNYLRTVRTAIELIEEEAIRLGTISDER